MSIADMFDCPIHLKNHPCTDCKQEYEDVMNSQYYEEMFMIEEYLNR